MKKFSQGQRWKYLSRDCDVESTLIIGHVEGGLFKSAVIHIVVEKVQVANGELIEISHMPFSEKALKASVTRLIETDVWVSPKIKNAIADWKADQGGVFEISVAHAVAAIVESVGPQFDDPFDVLVQNMRVKGTASHQDELMAHLFSLNQWYFLTDPEDARMPLQYWHKQDDPAGPAVLAFTSAERAAHAALQLGVCQDINDLTVMNPEVKDAVLWISGGQFQNHWLSFNLTQMDFPVWKENITKLYNQHKLGKH